MKLSSQLLLDFHFGGCPSLDNFHPGPNQMIKEIIHQWIDGSGEKFLYLWSPPGLGKSHILQAACSKITQAQKTVFYISLAEKNLSPDILDNLDCFDYICIDDIESIAGQSIWEEKLFHLYNQIKESENRLIVTAKAPPSAIKWILPDLGSRLCWGLVLRLVELTEDDKITALQSKAQARSMHLPNNVAQFLMQHYLRDTKSLFEAFERLDNAALVEKRKITVPFVKEVMNK